MIDVERIADRLLVWESLDSSERPEDPATGYQGDDEEMVELRRRAELLRRFDDWFGLSVRTSGFADTSRAGLPIVPGCEIRGVLGRGGMGMVYRGWQKELEREIAVKMLNGTQRGTSAQSRRFFREARVLARLRHEHIVPVYEASLLLGEPYFIMELMTGGSLASSLKKFSEPRAAALLMQQVARAVQHAHDHEILHRDLKPANILLDDRGRPRVSDFGLAKLFTLDSRYLDEDRVSCASASAADGTVDNRLTATNAIVGTPPYMAPEQLLTPNELGPAVDVWAMGVILYELLTGVRPFSERSPDGLTRGILESEPLGLRALAPQVPWPLEAIVQKCLTKNPTLRYATASSFADDLGRWLEGEAPLAYPDSILRRLMRSIRRHSTIALVGMLLVIGCFVVVALSLIAYRNAPQRTVESIVESLEAGNATVLIPETGPPKVEYQEIGAESTHQSADPNVPYFVTTHEVALIELWPNPPPTYSFEVELRHESNPSDGTIGVYFDYRIPDPVSPRPNCYVVSFTDRGPNSRLSPFPNGQKGSRVSTSFQDFELGEHGLLFNHAHRIDNSLVHFTPEPALGPSPWRRLRVDVGSNAVLIRWMPGEGLPIEQVRLENSTFERHARLISMAVPELSDYTGRLPDRGALGLFVSRSSASFRNAVLKPLSVEP